MTLTKSAKQDLKKSGLDRATIHAMGAYSVTEDHVSWLKKNGFRYKYPQGLLHELTEFYVLPSPQGGMRIKLLTPIEVDGKERKYLQPTGVKCGLYYLPECETKFQKTKKPIVFTEGEKKTAKLAQELGDDYLCIGATGVSTWNTEDWNKISLRDREFYIAYDRDVERNPDVEKQALALFLWMWKKEAMPYFLKFDGEKVDDWLVELENPKSSILNAVLDSMGNNDFYTYGRKINKTYLAQKLVQYGYCKSDAAILWKEVPWGKKSGIGINPLKTLIDRERVNGYRKSLEKLGIDWVQVNEKGEKKVVTGKLARAMMDSYRHALIFHHGSFWTYNEKLGVWEEENEGGKRVKAKIQEVLGDELVKKSLVEDIFFQMQNYAVHEKKDFQFDDTKGFLNLKNGVLNLNTMQLGNHDKDYYFTSKINANYDPKAKCPKFKKVLSDTALDKSTILRLQEWFGYCLIPDTRIEKALLLVGNQGTGKSTIIETLEKLLIDYRSSMDPGEIFHTFNLAHLRGKLVNICTDANTSTPLDERIKKLISGESHFAQFKGRDGFDFNPFARLIFSANDFLPTKDKSGGLSRRLDIIRVDKIRDEKDYDKELKKYIQENELDGVLTWALEGLERLVSNDFAMTDSAEMSENLEEYKEDVNPLRQFINDCCSVSTTEKTYSGQLYASYEVWCKMTGHMQMSASKMGREIRKIYPFVNSMKEGGGKRLRFYPYLKMQTKFVFQHGSYECVEVNDSSYTTAMTNTEKGKASKKNKSGVQPYDEESKTEEDNDDPQPPKPEPKQKEAEPEQEILAPYLAEGYGVDTFEEHKMGIVYDFHYEEKTICHKLVEDDAQLPQIASKIFAAHKNEALERKREEALKTESVVTKDMLADADTSESSLFELEETQYEDERGM